MPHMLSAYKNVIDEGFARSFGEGLALEKARAAATAQVTGETIEQARSAVQARGRSQSH
jgi:enoyl-CoA hydratase